MALTTIPSVTRPGVYLEVDASGAVTGTPVLPNRVLFIGSRLPSGSVAANVPTQIINNRDADNFWGVGSHIAGMVEKGRGANEAAQLLEQWGIALDDDAGGAAATGDITFTGTSTVAGTLRYRVAGRRIAVGIPAGTAAASVPALAVARDHSRVPAAPSDATGGELLFTARNDGLIGNDIDIRVDEIPDGLQAAVTGMSGGATNPTLTATIAAIAALRPQRIVLGYSDDASVTALEAELRLRAGWQREQFARGFVGLRGTAAAAITFTDYNSRFLTVAHFATSPSPPWEIAAAVAMVDASFEDPSDNRNGAEITGIEPPALEARLQFSDEEALLNAGVTPLVSDDYGNVSILRHVTTYVEDSDGNPDITWKDATTSTTLWACMYTADVRLSTRWKGAKIASDPVTPRPGKKILSPIKLQSEMMLIFDDIWVEEGWVEEASRSQFKATMATLRSTSDVGRLDAFIRPDLINSLHVIAIRVGFIL